MTIVAPTWSIVASVPRVGAVLTRAQAKAHCSVASDVTDDDGLFDAYIVAAADVVEQLAEIALGPTTFVRAANGFPCDDEAIVLPRPPYQTLTSIQYRDANGALQTWDASKYRLITLGRFASIIPAVGQCYPDTACAPDAVTVTFTAGYASVGTIPEKFMLAQRALVAHWYAHREAGELGDEVPGFILALIGAPARVDPLG